MAKKNKSKGNQTRTSKARTQSSYTQTAKEGLFMLLAAIAAGGAGAAIGKHSFLAGIPVTLIGVHKQNKYVIAAGLGLVVSNGFQKPGQPAGVTTQGVEGFDIKQITEQAKDRVGTFFKNFGDKLYLPKSEGSSTEGLGEDQVTYFVNPYSTKDLDMSAIDRIQEQIAQMNQSGASGLSEVDREF